MRKYIRLGEIPTDGKSVNFLKLTKKQKDDFCCASIPEECKECGVSVFLLLKNSICGLFLFVF